MRDFELEFTSNMSLQHQMAPQPKSKEFITLSNDEDTIESNTPHVDDDSSLSLSASEDSDDDALQSPSNSTQEGGPAYGFSTSDTTVYYTYCLLWSTLHWEKLVYGKGNWKSVAARKHKAKASTIEKKGKKQAQGKWAPAFLQECSWIVVVGPPDDQGLGDSVSSGPAVKLAFTLHIYAALECSKEIKKHKIAGSSTTTMKLDSDKPYNTWIVQLLVHHSACWEDPGATKHLSWELRNKLFHSTDRLNTLDCELQRWFYWHAQLCSKDKGQNLCGSYSRDQCQSNKCEYLQRSKDKHLTAYVYRNVASTRKMRMEMRKQRIVMVQRKRRRR